jgi:hypothetical protein
VDKLDAGHVPHKTYKRRYLEAEATQQSQWGIIDAFRRYGRLEIYQGYIQPENADYKDFNYATLRGWKLERN